MDRVIPIRAAFVKAFLLKGEGAVLVDAGPGGEAVKCIRRSLGAAGIGPGDLKLILITHAHFDHFGGAAELRSEFGAPIAIHEADAPYLRSGKAPGMQATGRLGRFLLRRLPQIQEVSTGGLEPDLVFSSSLDLRPYGIAGSVIPTPGHTNGSVSVVMDGGEAAIGDLLMGGFIRSRRPMLPIFADDVHTIAGSVSMLLGYNPKVLWPAHGGPLGIRAVRKLLQL